MSQPAAPSIELQPGVVALIPMRNVVLFPHVLVPISVGRAACPSRGDARNHCLVGRALRAVVGSQGGSAAPDTGLGANFARQGSVAQSDVEGFIHGRDLVEPAIVVAPRIGQYHAAGRETMVRPALAGAARRWPEVLPREAATWFVEDDPWLGRCRHRHRARSAAPGLPATVGTPLGGGAMLGDALSSFIKRRMGAAPSSRATGLDQIPEALLAAAGRCWS